MNFPFLFFQIWCISKTAIELTDLLGLSLQVVRYSKNFFSFMISEAKKVIIISDSMAKYVSGIEGVRLQAFRGDTVARLTNRIANREADLGPFDYAIVHVGTNDIARRQSFDSIMSDFANLIGIMRKVEPAIKIIISAILPRPVDHEDTDLMIRRVNHYLKDRMSKDLNFKFICTFKPFMFAGEVKREFFAKHDGLHLNTVGTDRLRYFFRRVIANM